LLEVETLEADEFVALIEGRELPPRPPSSTPTPNKTAVSEKSDKRGWQPPPLDMPTSPSPA
jgi:hypothetical protein